MNLVTLVKDWFGLVAVVIGLVSAIGFSVSAPWPAKADIEVIQQQVIDAQRQIQQQGCLILRVLLRGYLCADRLAAWPSVLGGVSDQRARRDE